ncbi:MAG TPA: CaiB/BaiF CoA-transferase family protein [Acidimicrobiales bacterium]|nr:CaiB/BaiF CoA-transferase family protein [Acidimicrobiales bacterium]
MQALEGVRVLDLTGGIAGPLGVLHLAEHGADVIKVEPPGGRRDRSDPASRVYNRSRRSITLDLGDPDGVGAFRRLCGTADVLVEAFAPGTMAGLGLGYEALQPECPGLVYCSVPAWPSGTRYQDVAGYEALVHARTGQQWEVTGFRRGPVFLHSPVASFGASFLVPIGIMAALVARQGSGRGQRVEVSLLQGAMSLTTQNWNWTDRGQFLLAKTHPPGIHQETIYECAGGEWIHAATTTGGTPTRSQDAVLGMEEVDFPTLLAMPAPERAEREGFRKEAFLRRDRASLIAELHEAGLNAEAIVAPHEKFVHPQLLATGSVVEVDDPDVGLTTQLGPTIFLEGTPGKVRGPQPPAGGHTDEILRSVGYDTGDIEAMRARGVI